MRFAVALSYPEVEHFRLRFQFCTWHSRSGVLGIPKHAYLLLRNITYKDDILSPSLQGYLFFWHHHRSSDHVVEFVSFLFHPVFSAFIHSKLVGLLCSVHFTLFRDRPQKQWKQVDYFISYITQSGIVLFCCIDHLSKVRSIWSVLSFAICSFMQDISNVESTQCF